MDDLEKGICRCMDCNSKIGNVGGIYVGEVVDKISLTEDLLKKYREIKFNADNSTNSIFCKSQEYVNNIITSSDIQDINTICVNIMLASLKRLRNYPKTGKEYYEIIYAKFIGKQILTYDEIAKKRKCSKQNVVNKKNEAISILASIMWDSTLDESALNLVKSQFDISKN